MQLGDVKTQKQKRGFVPIALASDPHRSISARATEPYAFKCSLTTDGVITCFRVVLQQLVKGRLRGARQRTEHKDASVDGPPLIQK